MSTHLLRNGEELGAFGIGYFGDLRLAKTGALLFKRMLERLTVCVKGLGGNRATEVAFSRFLSNDQVEAAQISEELAKKTNEASLGKSHVLCLQDTVQLTYPSQPIKKSDFGPTGDANTVGLFVHPGIIVDAANRDLLGISSVVSWSRPDASAITKKNRPIEEKESFRWIDTGLLAKNRISNAEKITIIGDRESDFLEIFKRVPDERTHLIIRASHDRRLEGDEKVSEQLEATAVSGTRVIELPKITGRRKARRATLEIKHASITLVTAQGKPLRLQCVHAMECSKVPQGESPISWVLWTTHSVSSLKEAIQILEWYTWRWIIEQLFRTMKNKGLKLEDSQIEDPKKLQILALLCIATAVKVMSLVESRNGKNNRSGQDFFAKEELILLALLCEKMEGKTTKQKNPYAKDTLSWVAWVIARLGGWNGYASESPPGPIVMLRGLQKFEMNYYGWSLAR